MKWKWKSLSLCDPCTIHGIPQARILEWVAFPFSRGFSWPRNQTRVSCIAGRFFTSWTVREAAKKAEHWRGDAFELWCWRRLLRVPWTARKSNQSILKEINAEYSLEAKMLKLKLQYFGHLLQRMTHWKRPWCWERLTAGGEGEHRGWEVWMTSPTQWTWVWASPRR